MFGSGFEVCNVSLRKSTVGLISLFCSSMSSVLTLVGAPTEICKRLGGSVYCCTFYQNVLGGSLK